MQLFSIFPYLFMLVGIGHVYFLESQTANSSLDQWRVKCWQRQHDYFKARLLGYVEPTVRLFSVRKVAVF